jgi:ATP-dependent DNA ligase
MTTLPFDPPVEPMLAKLERELPLGEGWRYEPKWDGFRSIVWRDGDEVYIQSRDLKPFNRYFPELVPCLARELPDRCVVDGEIVVAGAGGVLDFDSLQQRIHPAASRIKTLSERTPASFIAFDLLALGDEDLRGTPFVERRERLSSALGDGERPELSNEGSRVFVTPETGDASEAEAWFEGLAHLGVEGVVAKREDLRYRPGARAMVKVKKVKTADCVVGAYRMAKSGKGIGSLLLGLYDGDGVLHFVGHTASFKAQERIQILEMLRPYEGSDSFGHGRTPGGPSRWTQQELPWVPLRPELVVEVQYDKLQGDRFRHATTFVRWRTDKPPEECTFDQII